MRHQFTIVREWRSRARRTQERTWLGQDIRCVRPTHPPAARMFAVAHIVAAAVVTACPPVCFCSCSCTCSPSGGVRPSSAAIFRTATSRYTTAEQSTLEDLKCQICLNTLRQCVALEPCGHNFCATCLSHHLGNTLQSGLQLSCPFRCIHDHNSHTNAQAHASIRQAGRQAAPANKITTSAFAPANNDWATGHSATLLAPCIEQLR